MIKKLIRLFNYLIVNNIKFTFIKLFHCSHFKFSLFTFISPIASFDIQDKGTIIIEKKCSVLCLNNIGVREKGKIILKKGVFLNRNCQIIAHDNIEIGEDTCIGQNTIIMDHDHKFGHNGVEKKKFNSKKIIIGKNVWIGANCTILKGVTIGNNAVVAAGSIITRDIPDNSILIQKRQDDYINIK